MFLHVVEAGSFSGAARRLGCSQPAVSQTIRRLEDIYGGDLFARKRGGPLALTPIGQAVLPTVRGILEAVDRQMTDAAAVARGGCGTASVGFCPGLFEGLFRGGIAAFAAETPLVRLRLVEATPEMLLTALGRHRLDLVVSPLSTRRDHAEQESELLWNERLFAAVPKKGPRACRQGISPAVLSAMTLLWPPFMGLSERGRLLGFRTVDDRDDPHHEVLLTTILELVAMGLGTGILPESAAMPRPGVEFRPIEEGDARIAIYAHWLRDDANPLRHRLLRHLRTAANNGYCGAASQRRHIDSAGRVRS